MPTPDNAGKAMSSRLLTMKFMQRAAAASPAESPRTPTGPPSKRQRLSTGESRTPPSADAQALQDVLAAEELRRTQVLERQGAEKGETKWVLSTRDQLAPLKTPMRVVTAGFSTIDSSAPVQNVSEDKDEDEGATTPETPAVYGRRSFGRFNKTIERMQNPDLVSSDDDDSSAPEDDEDAGEEDEDEDDPTGTKAMIAQSRKEAAERARADRRAQRKAEKADLVRMAAQRRSKEVNLNASGRISNGGGNSPNTSNMTCFECGKEGHSRAQCPNSKVSRGRKRAPPR